MKASLFELIRKQLIASPGTYRWAPLSELWGVDYIELNSHLRILREHGFTRNDRGKVYWVKGDLKDVRSRLAHAIIGELKAESQSGTQQNLRCYQLDRCCAELRGIAFASIDIAQLQNRLKGQFDQLTLHRAVPKVGGTIGRCPATGKLLYYKFNSEVS